MTVITECIPTFPSKGEIILFLRSENVLPLSDSNHQTFESVVQILLSCSIEPVITTRSLSCCTRTFICDGSSLSKNSFIPGRETISSSTVAKTVWNVWGSEQKFCCCQTTGKMYYYLPLSMLLCY